MEKFVVFGSTVKMQLLKGNHFENNILRDLKT